MTKRITLQRSLNLIIITLLIICTAQSIILLQVRSQVSQLSSNQSVLYEKIQENDSTTDNIQSNIWDIQSDVKDMRDDIDYIHEEVGGIDTLCIYIADAQRGC